MGTQAQARRERDEGIARQLMAIYAPGVTLVIREDKEAHVLTEEPSEGQPLQTVYWNWKEGLTGLLHEIGHLHVSKVPGTASLPEDVSNVIEEAFAWTFAERAAKQHGIWFDYHHADRCYATYTGKLPVRMAWRFR